MEEGVADVQATVYITNHNYAKYLAKAIDSVLAQTFVDFELIVIDDGSTDESRGIIEQYRDHEKVRIVYQENKGLTTTNNIALRLARAPYIMRLDADDYLDPNALLLMTNKVREDPSVGLVFADYYLIDALDNVIGIERRHDFNQEVPMKDMPAHGACSLISRRILEDLGGYSEEVTCQDGYHLWINLVARSRVANINLPLFYYRQHGHNLTRDEERILSSRHAIIKSHVADLKLVDKRHVAIVPIRGMEEGVPFALKPFGGAPLLDVVLERIIRAENLKAIVVSTPDERVIDHVRSWQRGRESDHDKRLVLDQRPIELAALNVRLEKTVDHVLEAHGDALRPIDTITVLNVEYPFRSEAYIDKAINTLYLFEADSVIAVRPENAVFYRHDGSGLKRVTSGGFLRLEREIMYRETGGIHTVRYSHYKDNRHLVGGRVSHIIIDALASRAVGTELDWRAAELLYLQRRKAPVAQ